MSKYDRLIHGKDEEFEDKKVSCLVDVYNVLEAFEVTNPATAHAVKKLLACGQRGYKDIQQDLQEAIDSLKRAKELEDEKKCKSNKQ